MHIPVFVIVVFTQCCVLQARLLETIGTTRGFGDFDLKASYTGLSVKPFLTPEPDVGSLVNLSINFESLANFCSFISNLLVPSNV